MDLVHVGPLPPVRSGVADYSAALLPYLRPHVRRIAVVVDGAAPELPPGVVDRVCDLARGDAWPPGLPLYQMGNHFPYHRFVYRELQRRPGVVILHDGNLLPFVHKATLEQGQQRAAFVREVGFEGGAAGVAAAWTALDHGVPLPLEGYPLLARIARASLGVIVHSRCLRDRLLRVYPWARVAVIPHLNLLPADLPAVPRAEMKRSLGLDPDGLLVAAFGFIAPARRLEPALRAFARLRATFPRACFVCVGETAGGYDLSPLLAELSLGDAVRVTGYVPAELFLRYLRATDVAVNLRYPTWGESSGTLIRLMACGVPTLVTDAGAFAELPDGAVIKIPAGPDEEAAVEAALGKLLGSAEQRMGIGQVAREFVAVHGDPARVAGEMVAFLSADPSLVIGHC